MLLECSNEYPRFKILKVLKRGEVPTISYVKELFSLHAQKGIIVFANLITASRVFLLLMSVWFLSGQTPNQSIVALLLIILVFCLDVLDGHVARKFEQESDSGGMLDILADRVVENVLWFWFAHMELIPRLVPLAVLARCLVTDALRALTISRGSSRSQIPGTVTSSAHKMDWLVTSRFMRGLYGTMKVLTFTSLTLLVIGAQSRETALADYGRFEDARMLFLIKDLLVATTVSLCLLRALPVIRNGFSRTTESGLNSG